MPTKPLPGLLDRELSKVAAKGLIDVACPMLQEIINFATNAWRRCETSTSGRENEDLAAIMLYLHMIELTDGIEVLLRHSCPVPAIPLLRSCFEASLSIEYILESETEYVRRSLSWFAGYAHDRLRWYGSLDPSSPRGKHEYEHIMRDKTAKSMTWPTPDQVQQLMKPLTCLLAKPQFKQIECEYKKLRKLRGNPPWYWLFAGPSSLAELAKRLRRFGQYAIQYRDWSSVVHAADLSRFITRNKRGERAFWALRTPTCFREVALTAASFLLSATKLMLKRFRPTEDVGDWFIREVRAPFAYLQQLDVSIVEMP